MNVLILIWFLLPGALANMAPVLVKKINFLYYPIDFGKKFSDNERVLGSHKTFRGLFFAIIFSIFGVFIQKLLYNIEIFKAISIFDYSNVNILALGFLIGFGVMFGDAIGSFLKRRFKIRPGDMFFPIDQMDSAIFMVLFLLPFYELGFWFSIISVIVWLAGHMIINYLGWLLKIKRSKF